MHRAGRLLPLTLALVLLLIPVGVRAGSTLSITVSGGALHVSARGAAAAGIAAGGFLMLGTASRTGDFGAAGFAGPTYLIVDATPPEAQIVLDGRRLGTARQLVARAFPLARGTHTIEITAPTFRPYVARFSTGSDGFPVRVRAVLIPE